MVLMNKISTQQSTWMGMLESAPTTASTKERGDAIFFVLATDCDSDARVVID
jgi:hypothetical protein